MCVGGHDDDDRDTLPDSIIGSARKTDCLYSRCEEKELLRGSGERQQVPDLVRDISGLHCEEIQQCAPELRGVKNEFS